jgi:hypothetical protein
MTPARKVLIVMTNIGDLVIADIEQEFKSHSPRYILHCPALLVHQRLETGQLGFMFRPWVVNELLDSLSITLAPDFIVGKCQPTDSIIHFYNSWAKIEAEKHNKYAKTFASQVQQMEKYHASQSHDTTSDTSHPFTTEDLAAKNKDIDLLFESEAWGDPTVTH